LNLVPPAFGGWNPFTTATTTDGTLFVSQNAVADYQIANVWKDFTTVTGGRVIEVVADNAAYGTVTGGGFFLQSAQATLTATPATGYKFVKWTKAGADASTNNPYTFSVTEDATYVANFELIPPTPHSVTLFVDHADFLKWTKNDGTLVSSENPYTFDVTGDANLKAVFTEPNSINTLQAMSALNIYPNPSRGPINVETGGLIIEKITIHNAAGHVVHFNANVNNTSYEFNTEMFNAGFYTVSVQTKSGAVSSKLIVR
jgi:uncharacterized repeat protein (TIGR02543 family)